MHIDDERYFNRCICRMLAGSSGLPGDPCLSLESLEGEGGQLARVSHVSSASSPPNRA
jgi:hypothetical protein